MSLKELETKNCEGLGHIEDRERLATLGIFVEFETQNLREMGVHTAVLEAPQKSHSKSKIIKLVLSQE